MPRALCIYLQERVLFMGLGRLQQGDVTHVPLVPFLTALRRFMFRYLRTPLYREDTALHLYLDNPVRWPKDAFPVGYQQCCASAILLGDNI